MIKSLSLFLAAAALCSAVETRFWQQTDQSDFDKGTLTNLSSRSDGRLYLAPQFREVFDPSTPYLWSVVSDGKGHLYAGGGGSGSGTAKLFAIDAAGKGKALADLQGLEIHALAVGPDGQIYAATDPDGKVYRVSPQGKVDLFFDPKAKYIWALAFNRAGDLFVATGDQGVIYRVTRDGKGAEFFKTGETHARSLAMDLQDNLIVGTEPGGLILRVSAAGIGFVLYQTPKREVTAVAVAKSGEIYAAAVGTRSTTAPAVTLPAPAAPPPVSVGGAGTITISARSAPATTPATPAPIGGGSDVYAIAADLSPRRIWTNAQDIVYAVGFDSSGRPLIATGNRGKIYRVDSPTLSTRLIDASPTQITSFAATDGHLYVATGNIGRVYELGPGIESNGTFESEALDGGAFSYWGRLAFRGTPQSAKVLTRSGNLNRPQENWSPWVALAPEKIEGVPACVRCLNGRVASPSARFLQYKVELAGSGAPEIASVEIAYLAKNVAPAVSDIEIGPPNYRFPAATLAPPPATASPLSLSLPPMGQHRSAAAGAGESNPSYTLTYAKGSIGARWAASDENGDTLLYTVEIRGVGESAWKLLKDKVRDKYLTWDSAALPDGEYELRVTVSDAPSNVPDQTLSAMLVSEPFLIDNTPPQILNLTAAPAAGKVEVRWKARDARSIIDHAEYSVNGGDWLPVDPKAKLTDAPEEEYVLTLDRVASVEQTIAVRVVDAYDNQAVDKVLVK
jgi:hypothetical protein